MIGIGAVAAVAAVVLMAAPLRACTASGPATTARSPADVSRLACIGDGYCVETYEIDGARYGASCGEVREELILQPAFGLGDAAVYAIDGVDPRLLLAIRGSAVSCEQGATGGRWLSLIGPDARLDPEGARQAICASFVLDEAGRDANGCDGPPLPPPIGGGPGG